ncbi:hypothetical protein ACHAWF_005554 [Thalassiosira exigua]
MSQAANNQEGREAVPSPRPTPAKKAKQRQRIILGQRRGGATAGRLFESLAFEIRGADGGRVAAKKTRAFAVNPGPGASRGKGRTEAEGHRRRQIWTLRSSISSVACQSHHSLRWRQTFPSSL